MIRDLLVATLFVLVCQAAGLLGVLTTESGQSAWYLGLTKPSFNPPSWVFAPVWTTLYTMLGIAAWLVWRVGWDRAEVRQALALFGFQLVLNALWTPVFFGAHRVGIALLVITTLLLLVAAMVARFFSLSRLAGWLTVPYLLWLAFATLLNAAIWWLN